MGLHPRAGKTSSLLLLRQGPAADLLHMIHEFTPVKFGLLGAAQKGRVVDVCSGIAALTNAIIEPVECNRPSPGILCQVDVTTCTPTLQELARYDALISFSYLPYHDADKLGNVLAAYLESGRGGAVIGNYAFCNFDPDQQIRGRFLSMLPFTVGPFEDSRSNSGLHATWKPQHPQRELEAELFERVKRFSGGKGSIRCLSTETNGSIPVAYYDDGRILAAVRHVEVNVPGSWLGQPFPAQRRRKQGKRNSVGSTISGSESEEEQQAQLTDENEGGDSSRKKARNSDSIASNDAPLCSPNLTSLSIAANGELSPPSSPTILSFLSSTSVSSVASPDVLAPKEHSRVVGLNFYLPSSHVDGSFLKFLFVCLSFFGIGSHLPVGLGFFGTRRRYTYVVF